MPKLIGLPARPGRGSSSAPRAAGRRDRAGVDAAARHGAWRRTRRRARASTKGATVKLTVAKARPEVPGRDDRQPDGRGGDGDAREGRLQGAARPTPPRPDLDGTSCDQSPAAGRRRAPPAPRSRSSVGTAAATARRPRPRAPPRPRRHAVRVAVLAGGRSSEHEVSLNSAAAVREGVAAAGHEVVPVTIERDGAWRHDGEELRLRPGGGLLGRRRRLPGAARPLRRGRHGPGPARAARRALRRRGRARLVAVHGQGRLQGGAGRRRRAAGRLAGVRERALAGRARRRPRELAVLGTPVFVKPARLGSSVGHRQGVVGGRARPGARRRVRRTTRS